VIEQSSGELRREDEKVCLQVEMRTGCAMSSPVTPSLRAQRSNPESHCGTTLDCFAALAMTMWGERAPNSALVPRTQRSASSTVRCRAGAHLSERSVWRGSRLCAATLRVAARPGHEREAARHYRLNIRQPCCRARMDLTGAIRLNEGNESFGRDNDVEISAGPAFDRLTGSGAGQTRCKNCSSASRPLRADRAHRGRQARLFHEMREPAGADTATGGTEGGAGGSRCRGG